MLWKHNIKAFQQICLWGKLREKDTGIIECTYDVYRSFRFIETDFNKWLNKFRVKAEDLEVISNEEYDDRIISEFLIQWILFVKFSENLKGNNRNITW